MLRVNQHGRACIAEWIKETAAEPDRHALQGWCEQAEDDADSAADDAVHIEMSARMTASCRPSVLVLSRSEHFSE